MKAALIYYGCHRRGGVERLVFEAARYLASKQHEVHLLTGECSEIDLPPGGRPIIHHKIPLRNHTGLWSFYLRSSALARSQRFDVVNSHGVFCPTGGVHWANSVHRAWLEKSRQIYRPLSTRRWRQRLNPQHLLILLCERRHFRGGYRALIAASQQVACDLNRLYDVPQADIDVIHNGYDPEEFNPIRRASLREAQRARLGIGAGETAMLMVANELERKGLPVLLDAMQRLQRPELKLIVAGRAPYERYLPRIASLGLQDQVRFVGPSSDVGALHAAADFFVLPTQYEAFCLAILEALGSGLPVLTSSVPGAGDTIIPGVNGLLVHDPRDVDELARGIETLSAEAIRTQMQHEASESVQEYRWNRLLGRYEEIMLRLAAAPTVV